MRRATVMLGVTVAAVWLPGEATAQDGQSLYRRQCSTCHATEAGQNKIGPTMHGIAGSKSAGGPGFEFSDPTKAPNPTWTGDPPPKNPAHPQGTVPGTKSVYPRRKNPP